MRPGHLYGTDPEFVILDDSGRPRPAHRFGFPVKGQYIKTKNAAAGRDGFLVETNTLRGYESPLEMAEANKEAMELAEMLVDDGSETYKLRAISSFNVDLDDLYTDAPPDVSEFGCQPSMCSYSGKPKVVHLDARHFPTRFGGGHMHVATITPNSKLDGPVSPVLQNPKNYRTLGKLSDLYIGAAHAYVYNGPEQFIRRQYYGQAGEFRPQKYGTDYMGFEYRTPPAEIWNHPAMISLSYGIMGWIINNFYELEKKWKGKLGKPLQKAINDGYKIENWIQEVPGFYDSNTLAKLRGIPDINQWSMTSIEEPFTYKNWATFAYFWGLQVPPHINYNSPSLHPSMKINAA